MHDDTKLSLFKGATAWVAVALSKVGIHQWSDAAAMAATLYSVLLIGEWLWKRVRSKKN